VQEPGVDRRHRRIAGAFADASSWNGVIGRLQQQGYTVIAAANPLRGLAADSAYTASLLNQIDGPVLLVGHSYAGAVITTAATSTPNVVGLVYIAAFATEEGENLNDVESGSKDSILGPALVQYKYPAGPDGETAVEFAVNPALFREAFAADLPPETTALMAATQRPTAVTAFSEASGPPAWAQVNRDTTTWRGGSPAFRLSPCPPSPWRETPTAGRTRTPAPRPANSPASTSTGSSRAASGTTCCKRLRSFRRSHRRRREVLTSEDHAAAGLKACLDAHILGTGSVSRWQRHANRTYRAFPPGTRPQTMMGQKRRPATDGP
jgi:pimeloyl-ACP methyl ester carboxylesterase